MLKEESPREVQISYMRIFQLISQFPHGITLFSHDKTPFFPRILDTFLIIAYSDSLMVQLFRSGNNNAGLSVIQKIKYLFYSSGIRQTGDGGSERRANIKSTKYYKPKRNTMMKNQKEKKVINVLDTVHYWAFCIADAYRDEMLKQDLGCDEMWQIAEYFSHKFVKSYIWHHGDMSGYDACMTWCEEREDEIMKAIENYGDCYEIYR